MKQIKTFINESKEDITYKDIPVKEVYKSCVKGYKKWANMWHKFSDDFEDFQSMSETQVEESALTLMAPSFNFNDDNDKIKWVKGKGPDYSIRIKNLKEFFETNWDNNFESGKRTIHKDSYGDRYYFEEFNLGDTKINMFYQMGPMPELNKYKVK
jgi:hypothetical protein